VVSSNTSGILLRTITEGLPERLRRDIAVTHFFNPVRMMKLVELVPGADTRAEVIRTFEHSGLHQAHAGLADGLSMEQIDALLAAPFGIPPTGLYGCSI
jgi:3-hydroxyacyl-CoA dehydrogenase